MTGDCYPPLSSEILSQEDMLRLTGSPRSGEQIKWLNVNGWHYVRNRAGKPIVGLWYARYKLAGQTPLAPAVRDWQPDLSYLP